MRFFLVFFFGSFWRLGVQLGVEILTKTAVFEKKMKIFFVIFLSNMMCIEVQLDVKILKKNDFVKSNLMCIGV